MSLEGLKVIGYAHQHVTNTLVEIEYLGQLRDKVTALNVQSKSLSASEYGNALDDLMPLVEKAYASKPEVVKVYREYIDLLKATAAPIVAKPAPIQPLMLALPPTYIYFVEAVGAGRIKIGFSANPEKRIRGLTTSSAHELKTLKVIEGELAQERSIHRRFAHLRTHLEWFQDAPELREYIESL